MTSHKVEMRVNSYDFSQRVAIVVGGAGGIGTAITERLVAGGAKAVIFDLDADTVASVAQATGALAFPRPVDCSVSETVDAAIREVEATHGSVDILIYTAGIAGESPRITDVTDTVWDKIMTVNCAGAFYCMRAVIPGMLERDYGRIVLISSIAGKEGNADEAAYSASKAALIALGKSVAKAYATTGIRVHSVAPGIIDAPLGTGPTVTRELFETLLSRVPMKRPGLPTEVATLTAFLASEEFDFSTGSCFDLSGGRAVY
jgi:2-dehydro-3-deoxy-L-rhamnonate dehydrogenase (NAD+)